MTNIKFGKQPKKNDYRTLLFKNYAGLLVPPPVAYSVLDQVYSKVGISDPARLFPLDGNDSLGDCVACAIAHAETVYHALIGTLKVASTQTVENLYFKLTGGVDSGLVELDTLNYWRKHRISGDQIIAYASIDPKNHDHIKQAIHLFGGVLLGFQVQRDCIADFNAGKPWTPGPLLNEGHAVQCVAYNADTVTVLTWGNVQSGTWGWFDTCVDEAYGLLPPEAKTAGFAPGFNFTQLYADLTAVTN